MYLYCIMAVYASMQGVYAVLMPWWIEITCLNQRTDCNRFEYTKLNVIY